MVAGGGKTFPTDGIVLIDKEEGETSYSVVKKVKSALGGLKNGKVGHAGTLDPFATGLLIILIGQGTKLSPYIMSESKVYLSTMMLGVETDTLDHTGRVVRVSTVPGLRQEYIQEQAQSFVGDIEQIPPIYSAVRYRGLRAHKLARKGIMVELQKRKVSVQSFRIVSVCLPYVSMEVKCSSGTYIRSLAADLGTVLGPGGHLKSLRRLASGSFEAQDAISSKEFSRKDCRFLLRNKMIPLWAALPNMPEIKVDEFFANKVRHGYQPTWKELNESLDLTGLKGGHVKLQRDSELVAVIRITRSEEVGDGKVKIDRVFF